MNDPSETRESLLNAIRDPCDHVAWDRFAEIYRPMVFRLARRLGLQDADAEDVTQQVMVIIAAKIGQFEKDASKGRFRDWLAAVAKNAIRNALTRRPRDIAIGGDGALPSEQIAVSDDSLSKQVEEEYMRSVFRVSAAEIKDEFAESTWAAFWMTCVEGQPVKDAAQKLGLTAGAVYAARSRVMRRLKQTTQAILDEEENA